MDHTNQSGDLLEQPPKLTGMLNVLTILTFIGCGLGYLSAIWGFTSSADPQKQIDLLREQAEDASGFAKTMIDSSIHLLQVSFDHRNLLLITGLVFTTMCLIGAIWMRKLKKSGYFIYVIGELAPVILFAGLLGANFLGAIQLLFGGGIALLFVVLYSTQLKYLVNK